MPGRIVVVGSSNIDLVMKMARLPKTGETVTDATFVPVFGGKGANQAVGAARAGGDVAFVGCVGDDSYGEGIVSSLREAGIDTQFVFHETGTASGTALIMVGGEGHNYISVAPGANHRLTPAHVDRARDAIAQAAMIVTQCEITQPALDRVVELGAQAGRPVLLNLAPARLVNERTLARLAYLAVNETEAELLTGAPVRTDAEIRAAADALLARGPRTVLVTLGARGAYVAGDGSGSLVPSFAVEAVDTTAAGDVHCGALAVALVEGRPLEEAVRFANAAAALSVTRLGSQRSAPVRTEIDGLVLSGRGA
jgi:ribokinase